MLLEEGHCFREQALAYCHRRTSPSRATLDASSLSTLVQMVSAGLGVTLIPEMALALETRSAAVAVARFKDPQPSRTVGMIWRKGSPLAAPLQQLSEVVRRAAGERSKPRKAKASARKRRTLRGLHRARCDRSANS